jgi:hypothetical protein
MSDFQVNTNDLITQLASQIAGYVIELNVAKLQVEFLQGKIRDLEGSLLRPDVGNKISFESK